MPAAKKETGKMRQSVYAHQGNVPPIDSEKVRVSRLSWMGASKTESVVVTFEDEQHVQRAEEARKNRSKVMEGIKMQLGRINEMLEHSPSGNNNNNNASPNKNSNKEEDSSATRSRGADPKYVTSFLDGTTHSRFSISAYNSFVRAKMMDILEAHPPNSTWPRLPGDEEFHIPAISEGTGVTPSNITSAATWREMLGGRGTIGYNTRASACAKEIMQYEHFQGVDFGADFNESKSKKEQQQQQQQQSATSAAAASTPSPAPAASTEKEQQQQEEKTAEQQQPKPGSTYETAEFASPLPKMETTSSGASSPASPPCSPASPSYENANAASEAQQQEQQQAPPATSTTAESSSSSSSSAPEEKKEQQQKEEEKPSTTIEVKEL